MSAPQLPDGVLSMASRGPDWAAYVASLPGLLGDLLSEWELVVDGAPTHGFAAVVVPVRSRDGVAAVLKVAFPDEETRHEALALQRWGGRGAVRLLRADPHRRALLLERLSRRDLGELWDVEACEVVGAAYADLHVPALPQLRTLSSYVGGHLSELVGLPRSAPIPHRLVEQAVSLAHDLVGEPDTDARLIHTDLHYENVLAADPDGHGREWLVIDPKPLSGDPHYEPAPMLWNRWEELAGDVRDGVRRRFHTLVDIAGLDEDRARAWVVVRMVLNAAAEIRAEAPLDADWLTTCITVAKAVQD